MEGTGSRDECDGVQKVIAQFKTKFIIACKLVQFLGDEFKFLKKTYKLGDDGMDILLGHYAETMTKFFEEKYGTGKGQQVPCGDETQGISSTIFFSRRRSFTVALLGGHGPYLSQEQTGIGYVIK